MSRVDTRGYALVSQQIREKIIKGDINVGSTSTSIKDGIFCDARLESRVQPSSFDPVIGDELYVLDIEQNLVFAPNPGETVKRTLLKLPGWQRKRVSIPKEGLELKKVATYAIPLIEKFTVRDQEVYRSSPKSSTGRVFPITRMVTDFNPGFDSIHYKFARDKELQSWLIIQPTAFNLIVTPGLSLNQLRPIQGTDASLSQGELLEEITNGPLIIGRDNKKLMSLVTNDGLQIRPDLTGEYTHGIVALRARKNPDPIDLSKKGHYDPDDFFEPVKIEGGKIRFANSERYLIASKGILNVPPHLSAELRRHYGAGVRGSWDEAGFIDPNWLGDLVFEVHFNETGDFTLGVDDERAVSTLEFFRTNQTPDKLYGAKIGSHYRDQQGLRVSKHFKPFDFARAARDYKKLNREVLVHDANILRSFRTISEGFEPIRPDGASKLVKEIESNGFFHYRFDCETDEDVLQVIPYVLLFDKKGRVFTYARAVNIQDYGDERLFGKYSIGVGGHISSGDAPDYIRNCIIREVTQEEVKISGKYSDPRLLGTILVQDKPVDRVHFGLVYAIQTSGNIRENESSITKLGMKTPAQLNSMNPPLFETWSRRLMPYLHQLH